MNITHEQLRKQLLARQDAKKEADRLQRIQQALAQTSKVCSQYSLHTLCNASSTSSYCFVTLSTIAVPYLY
jgi:hypothetical protein